MTKTLKYILPVVLILLGVLIYSNTLKSSFHFDDFQYITQNQNIYDVTNVKAIWEASARPSRFISFYSFALNYHFGKDQVVGYHIVNIFIHILNAFFVWWFGRLLFLTKLLKSFQNERIRQVVPIITACLFLTHPLQTESVTYIVQRFTSLATLFYLLSVSFYLKARFNYNRRRYFFLCLITTILAMLSKEIALTLPLTILSLELFFFKKDNTASSRRPWKWILSILVLLLLVPLIFQFDVKNIIAVEVPARSHPGDVINAPRYLLTQFRVIPTYLKVFVAPIGQTLDYDFKVTKSIFEVKAILGGLFLLFTLISGIMMYRRNILFSFGIIWFFITILVTSSIIPIPQVIFEHRMYLPSIGLFFAVSALLSKYFLSFRKYIIASVILVLTLSYLTYQRNEVYRTDKSLWLDIVAKAPKKVRAYNNLGMAYLVEGDVDEAIKTFNQAIILNPHAAKAYNNRGLAYTFLSRDKLAMKDYTTAIKLLEGHQALGDPLARNTTKMAIMYINRGNIFVRAKQYTLALNDYSKAIVIDPHNAKAYYNKGYVSEMLLDYSTALNNYTKAIELDAYYARAYVGRGFVLNTQNKTNEAIADFDHALKLEPQNGQAYFYRSVSQYELGQFELARLDMLKSQSLGYKVTDPQLVRIVTQILNGRKLGE